MGGILEAFIANRADVTAITKTEGKVTAITMAAGTGSTTAKFKKFSFRRGTGSLTTTLTADAANDVNFWTSDLLLQFNRMENTKRNAITTLSLGDLIVMVKDANGIYWLLGQDADRPVRASAGDGQTGTAHGDANRYTITLQEIAPEPPAEILVGTGGVDLSTIVG